MMFSEKCQEIENHLKFLLSMDPKAINPSFTRDAALNENNYYSAEANFSNQKQRIYKTDRKHNSLSKCDHIQNSQRTPESKKPRRKVPINSDGVNREKNLLRNEQSAITEDKKLENFSSRSSYKRQHRINKKQNEHDNLNTGFSHEFMNRISGKEIHSLTENDCEHELEKSHQKYNAYSKGKDFSKKYRKQSKNNNTPKSLVIAQKSQAADFKDTNVHTCKNESINLVKDRRTQASIFKNALEKASSNELKKENELYKLSTNSGQKDGVMENIVSCKNDMLSNFENNITLNADNQPESLPNKTECASNILCKNSLNSQSTKFSVKGKLASSPANFSKMKAKYESFKENPTDNFITSCSKPNCNCSDDILYCTLCDFHIDNLKELIKHKKNVSHQFRKEDFYRVQYLKELPQPNENQLKKMEELFENIFKYHALDVDDVNVRTAVVDKLKTVLGDDIKDCELHLFGSSVNGFGLKDSNVNIDLAVPQGISPSRILLNTYEKIKEREDKYINVWKDFTAAVPKITFLDRSTNLTCEITLNNELSGKTSRLFAQYAYCDEKVRKLGIIFRYWAKICEIDQQHICSLPSYCYPLMVIFFLQQHNPPVIPVLHDLVDFDVNTMSINMRSYWKRQNNESIAKLWMEMLKFYGTEFQYKQHVISICQLKSLLCSEKKWTTRMMCIEDPFHNKRNIGRSIANQQWFHYIVECIRSTYEYFITCHSPSDPVSIDNEEFENDGDYDDDDCDDDEEEEEENDDDLSTEDICERFEEDLDNALDSNTVKTIISNMNIGNEADGSLKYTDHGNQDIHENSNSKSLNINDNCQLIFSYEFKKSNFISAKQPNLFCRQCQKHGHFKQNCTVDDNLPDLKPLPKMDGPHKQILTEVCEIIFDLWKLSPKVMEENKSLLYNLQKHIQYEFPDARLELFGSSCNGFGFTDSDLDICLTFVNKSGEALNQQSIIEHLTVELKKYKKIQDIIPIPTAKVPIIKFSFKHTKREGDISVYNTLGQHNTKLLSTYSKIDSRVQKLGYVLKFFAKTCDICDASRGSLSSYAYILMVLYYLQQRDPPVIPVLQELYDKTKPKPVRKVDGWNTWFYEEVHNLQNIWPHYKKNNESLGELWLGLLRFYTEHFKVNELVVCIRQKEPLTRFEKLWNTKSIAIEDPFDQSHNLGAGVSRKMNAFIFSAFRRGREHFGRTPPNRRDMTDLLGYFFNRKIFTDGKNPPNERGCRICYKIGHKMKDCPLKRMERFRPKQFFGGKRKTGNNNQNKKFQDKNIPFNERNMANKSIHWNHTANSHFQQSRGITQNTSSGINILQNYLPLPKNSINDTTLASGFQQHLKIITDEEDSLNEKKKLNKYIK